MAKRMAASMKAAWEAAKKDFTDTPNAEMLKQDVIDVLDFARNKAAMVKRSSDSSPRSLSASGGTGRAKPRVNQDVGAELLTHFKDEWADIHNSTETSSLVASELASDLQHINMSVTQSHALINKCREEFTCLREIVEVLDEAQGKVNEIGELVQQVEQAIHDYSHIKAELANERRKHSLQKQHEKVVSENRTRVEQMRKVLLNEQHLSASLKYESDSKDLKERQEAFQEIFDKQMADYRKKGEVDQPIDEVKTKRSMSQLEEVVIEDEDGTASLHEFLSDVVIDQSESLPDDMAAGEDEAGAASTEAAPISTDATPSEV